MKVYAIPGKTLCPIRIQMSDDDVVAAIQVRDEDDIPFYWLLISPAIAQQMVEELGMKVVFTLPDTPDAQLTP